MNNYKFYCVIVALCALVLLSAGCTAFNKSSPSEKEHSMLQKIYIDSVDSKAVVLKDEVLEVKIKGNLPSPAYTFERFDIEVRGKTIEISPLARHDANKMVIQVLVPFEEVCRVDNLKPGIYEIKVNGRGDTAVSKSQVRVNE
ncbi:MAG: hypothetical protein ACE5HS_06485 [bacterium]